MSIRWLSRLAVLAALGGCTAQSEGLDPSPPTLVGVEVSPGSLTLAPGDSAPFRAIGRLSDGDSSAVPIVWNATGGLISGSGMYRAGLVAGSWRVVASAAGGVADTAQVTITASPATLTGVTVTPGSATLAAGASAGFSATGQYSDGSSGAVAVTWSATGGTVTQSGLYTAGGTAGSFRVIARSVAGPADTALITITAAPVTLTGVSVTPGQATLDPGANASFAATGQYSDGSNGAVAVTWTATGGSVTGAGVYTAGPTAGTFRVVATATQATLADTAVVTIRDTTTPPPPPPPPPPGATVLLTEAFENASVGGRGWYDNTNPVITTVEKHGGAAALEMTYPQGGKIPTRGGALRHKFTATDRVYLRYWVKYSANWVGSGVNYHPHEFYFVTNEDGDWVGPSATHLTTYVEHVYQNGGSPRVHLQDALNIDATRINQDLTNVTEQRSVAGCNGETDGHSTGCYQSGGAWYNEKGWRTSQPAFTDTPGPGYKNAWHQVEAYFQLNSIQNGKGVPDGVVQYWFDGQLLINHQNVLFRTGAHPNMKFQQVLIAPYIGVGSPVTQSMWVDDLVVATGRVP